MSSSTSAVTAVELSGVEDAAAASVAGVEDAAANSVDGLDLALDCLNLV